MEGYEKNGCIMSRGEAIQRATIALAAVAVVAGAAIAYFSYTNPGSPGNIIGSSRSTCALPPGQVGNATVTITETAGQFPPCGCALADSNSDGTLYVSTNTIVGDNVCMTASLEHSAGVYLRVTNATGSLVFSGNCVALPPPGAPPPTGDTCTAYWDTAKPDPQGNPIEPGSYRLIASGGEGSQALLEANFSLTSNGAVATVTATQEVTAHALNTTSTLVTCTNGMPTVTTTTTTTSTVGAGSTTTVTVSTTSTSYSQTVTVSGCTSGVSTITATSTVTTTVTP